MTIQCDCLIGAKPQADLSSRLADNENRNRGNHSIVRKRQRSLLELPMELLRYSLTFCSIDEVLLCHLVCTRCRTLAQCLTNTTIGLRDLRLANALELLREARHRFDQLCRKHHALTARQSISCLQQSERGSQWNLTVVPKSVLQYEQFLLFCCVNEFF